MIDLFAMHHTGHDQTLDYNPHSPIPHSGFHTDDPTLASANHGHPADTGLASGHHAPHGAGTTHAHDGYAPPLSGQEHVHVSADGGKIFGDPVSDFSDWHHQAGDNSCAVVAQMGVYESVTHQHMTEQQLCDFAQAHGWYNPQSGTPPQCIGNVLNALGVPTEQHYNGSLSEIAGALARGDKVIVGVNANDIWHAEHAPDGTPLQHAPAGHAVWVTGINVAPDGSATVYLNDSGTAHGGMMSVDARDFVNAWKDYGNLTVISHAA
jgi:hypothetical protein